VSDDTIFLSRQSPEEKFLSEFGVFPKYVLKHQSNNDKYNDILNLTGPNLCAYCVINGSASSDKIIVPTSWLLKDARSRPRGL